MPAIICKANFNTTCPRKLQGDLQNAEFVAGFQFREECFLLQLKRGVSGQDRGYSFRNARNRVDAAQRLQRFVLCEVSFEETFHRRFAVLALNVHRLCHTGCIKTTAPTTCNRIK
jgi:hypothetical protein